jgi:hypothetical protein
MLAPDSNVRIAWRERPVRTAAEKRLVRRMHAGGIALAKIIQSNISTPGPSHSFPGQYPHRISGRLHASIHVRVVGMDVQIVARVPHAKYVERTRPFMRRSLEENRAYVKRVIQRAGARGRR